jgi:hypothetical protein
MKTIFSIIAFLLSLTISAQVKDTTKLIVGKDTVLVIGTTVNRTETISYTYPVRTTTTEVRKFVEPAPIPEPEQPPVVEDKIYGFGANAKGGEGKTVYEIRTVNDFNKYLGSNRTLKFVNDLKFTARINLSNISYLTIDGNGYDVQINNNNNGDGISFDGSNCHHNIVKGLTVYGAGNDNINVINGAHDIAIIGCYVYDAEDGNIDVASGYNVTIAYNILAGKSGNGNSLCTGKETTYYMNAFIGDERNPMVHANYTPVGNPNAYAANNLMYNWTGYASGVGYKAKAVFKNNHYQSTKNPTNTLDNKGGWGNETLGYIFASGNTSAAGDNANRDSNMNDIPIPDWAQVPLLDSKEAAKIILSRKWANPAAQSLINGISLR